MTDTNNPTRQRKTISLTGRMLAGAAIGLMFMSFFLITAGAPNPEWGKLWMIRPIIVIAFAGALGGLCCHFLLNFRALVSMSKPMAIILSIIIFIVGLWMGTVLGLDGTMWD
ncbi:MAG: potassium transporter KefB [Chryseolinea sp.]